MDISLVVHNGTNEYTHSPTPAVVIDVKHKHNADTEEVLETIETWSIEGLLVPTENDTVDEQVAELETQYASGILTSAKLVDDATGIILEELPTDRGIRVTSLAFPEGHGPEWATRRRYRIGLEGNDYTTAIETSGDVAYTISYATAQSSIITRTIVGNLRDMKGQDATTLYATYKTAQGWATWADANLISDTYAQNKDNTVCTFNIVHRKRWFAFPSGITNADVSTTTMVDAQGMIRKRYSGWYEGSAENCLLAIIVLRGSDVIVSESVTRNAYTYRTSFSLNTLTLTQGDLIYSREVLTIMSSIDRFVHKPVLGGGNPIKQYTSRAPAQARQSGMIRNLRDYPLPPYRYWADEHLIGESVVRISPEFQRNFKEYIYGLAYDYMFEFAFQPIF